MLEAKRRTLKALLNQYCRECLANGTDQDACIFCSVEGAYKEIFGSERQLYKVVEATIVYVCNGNDVISKCKVNLDTKEVFGFYFTSYERQLIERDAEHEYIVFADGTTEPIYPWWTDHEENAFWH